MPCYLRFLNDCSFIILLGNTICLQLCRNVENDTLWACLAVLSWQNHQFEVAEEAFARINLFYQASYIRHVRVSSKKL